MKSFENRNVLYRWRSVERYGLFLNRFRNFGCKGKKELNRPETKGQGFQFSAATKNAKKRSWTCQSRPPLGWQNGLSILECVNCRIAVILHEGQRAVLFALFSAMLVYDALNHRGKMPKIRGYHISMFTGVVQIPDLNDFFQVRHSFEVGHFLGCHRPPL